MNNIELHVPYFIETWRGDITNVRCAVTGTNCLFYDMYADAKGNIVCVGANTSDKIKRLLAQRYRHGQDLPLEFRVDGCDLTVVLLPKPPIEEEHTHVELVLLQSAPYINANRTVVLC